MKKFLILDCYVDEPACLGVPPFISPYPRLIAGALISAGIPEENIIYNTIDHIRHDYIINSHYDEVFLIGGAAVPGRYLGAKIGTFAEIKTIISSNRLFFSIGGLVSRLPQFGSVEGNFRLINGDIEAAAFHSASGILADRLRTNTECSDWAARGSFIAASHQEYPFLIAEIETYRGCPRENKCSFCSENIHGKIEFREESAIINEIDSLISAGINRFRLGRQADITAYGADFSSHKNGFPKPSFKRIRSLFDPINERIRRGTVKSLFIDNANPGQIAAYEDEEFDIISLIAESVTEGDTMALGAESFDPALIAPNNLKANADEIFRAVKIINKAGSARRNGVPAILPGINLIHGLAGETDKTFRINFERLSQMLDDGLLIKRINIRKIQPFPGTPLYDARIRSSARIENRYEFYKEKIRNEIDSAMLGRIYPSGTILNDLRTEETASGYSYARQIASYPIICKIPGELEIKKFFSAAVLGNKERSLTALSLPLEINSLNSKSLEYIPGIGKKASSIILQKPLTRDKLAEAAPGIKKEILDIISF